jgi:hypothetical protein
MSNAAGFPKASDFDNGSTLLNRRGNLVRTRRQGTSIRAHARVALCDDGGVAVTGLRNPEIRR